MKSLVDFAEEQAHDESVLRAGLHGEFWKVLRGYLTNLRAEAIDTMLTCDPTNTARVAECQKTAQVCDALITHVESFSELDG